MECVTNTKHESVLTTRTQFALVLTQISLSAFVGALSAENIERQKNDYKTNVNYLFMV